MLLPAMANRHGLIAGATGTGKTVTLRVLAEAFSARGVPVFLADAKGDLAGLGWPAEPRPSVLERARALGLEDYAPEAFPVTFWDVHGEQGHPVRTTLTEMGPLLLGRLLQLNEVQQGVLDIAFRVADEHGLLLLDLKDLRALLTHLAENATAFAPKHGNISAASVGAIQRGLASLGDQGGDLFFGEPALNLEDLMQTDGSGRGVINILAADRLLRTPRVYATLLLWMLSELFENLPEVGDPVKPRLVFFFDEAHLLFSDIAPAVLERIDQVVRLIRSKGVGIYFITQNPSDIPDTILGQLGNRIQHGLRAFTPRDQKGVRAAAATFRSNPALDTEAALTQLAVGEALVSLLDARGQPTPVERVLICPPRSQLGPVDAAGRRKAIAGSLVAGVYDTPVDRESAYERLSAAHGAASPTAGGGFLGNLLGGADAASPLPTVPASGRGRGRTPDSLVETMAKSAVRTAGSSLGRAIVRGILGSIFGGRRR